MNGWLMNNEWLIWRGVCDKAVLTKFNVAWVSEKNNEKIAMVGLRVEMWMVDLPITKQECFNICNT